MKHIFRLWLAVTFCLSFTACGDGAGVDDPPPSGSFGETLPVSGKRVHVDEATPSFDATLENFYVDDWGRMELDELFDEGEASGSIDDGILTLSLGKPKESVLVPIPEPPENPVVSPAEAKWIRLRSIGLRVPLSDESEYKGILMELYQEEPNQETYADYVYVDRDVKVTGAKEDYTIDLDLKAGWNCIIQDDNGEKTGKPTSAYNWYAMPDYSS